MGTAHKLLDEAASPTMERIRRDRQRVPTQLQPLLAYLEEHLFDPDLDANQLKRACGVRDNSLPIYFHHALALPPYAYIEDCRLEVACRLLRDTDLKVWQIAQLLGYSTLQVFSRAFDRWSGLRPSVFRRRAKLESQATAAGNGSESEALLQEREESSVLCLTTLRKAVSGGLQDQEADDLARHLFRLYPDAFRQAASVDDPTIRLSAEQAWDVLRTRPHQERRELVKRRWQTASVELFHLLVEKGMNEARHDAERGVEIAELALDCLEALDGTLAEDQFRELEVKGCAWLASAYRFALDLPQAEVVLQRGERALQATCDPAVRAEIALIKSAVRAAQYRTEEALELAHRLVASVAELKEPAIKLRVWLHRASLYFDTGEPGDCLQDLHQAREWIDRVHDRYLHGSFYQLLIRSLAFNGRPDEADRLLPEVRSVVRDLGLEQYSGYLEWTEGIVSNAHGETAAAESHFLSARHSFYAQNRPYPGAVVALDLAILHYSSRRYSDTLRLAAEALEVFEGMKVPQEALKAVQLLQHAIASREITERTLRRVRASVAKAQPGM